MKLTKAQRLFVAIGHIDKELIRYVLWEKRCADSRGKIKPSHCRARLIQIKKLRKKLIREALCAWEKEQAKYSKKEAEAAYHRGHKVGFDAGFSALMF